VFEAVAIVRQDAAIPFLDDLANDGRQKGPVLVVPRDSLDEVLHGFAKTTENVDLANHEVFVAVPSLLTRFGGGSCRVGLGLGVCDR